MTNEVMEKEALSLVESILRKIDDNEIEAKRKDDIIHLLYLSFNNIQDEWVISSKDIALIFRGGRYAKREIEDLILSRKKICTEKEKIVIRENFITFIGSSKKIIFNYYINLPFLSSIINDVTDDQNDLQAFYCFFRRVTG